MIEKIKKLIAHPHTKELKDVRVLGLIVFGFIVLLVSWSGVRVIETNYRLQQQIARLEEETKLLELESTNKKLENEYYKTDQYLELQARGSFGKAAPGETVLVVPESVALKNTKEMPKANDDQADERADKPTYQKNLESWTKFLFRKNTSS